jgi:hypothetical protein
MQGKEEGVRGGESTTSNLPPCPRSPHKACHLQTHILAASPPTHPCVTTLTWSPSPRPARWAQRPPGTAP